VIRAEATPAPAAPLAAGADIEARIARIEARLGELTDRQAIGELIVEYNRACDLPADKGAAVAACFTPDGRWDSVGPHANPAWSATGRAALTAKFDRNVGRMPFSAHFVTNGTVRLDGDRATGSWTYFQTATYRDGTALWIAGRYLAELTRLEGCWLIDHLRVHNWFTSPYASGWAEVEHLDTP
jgi:hypothetical protein